MSNIPIKNNYNDIPVYYKNNEDGKTSYIYESDGSERFDRTLMEMKPKNNPSFVNRVYSKEELQKLVDDEVKSNESKKKTLYEMLRDSCTEGERARFKFAGEEKIYTIQEFIAEMEKRSEMSK